jgi:YVTN family beta-propeller protein
MNWKFGLAALMAVGLTVNTAPAAVARSERVLVALESGGAVLLDAHNGKALQTYATGPNAFGAMYSPDGKRAFVTDKDKGTLIEIDTKSNKVLDTIHVGVQPQQPAMTTEGRIYIPLSGDEGIAIVDASKKLQLIKKIPTGAGTKPHIVSLSPDGKTLWATVQGTDPKVIAVTVEENADTIASEYRYNLFPRVIAAGDGFAYFTGHHSTGIHKALFNQKDASTIHMDQNGSFSEAAKQVEGIAIAGSKLGYTHEGRKALVVFGSSSPTCDIAPLADKPYWVSLDSMGQVALVSIPGKGLVEAYDILTCDKSPLWSVNVGGKAKRMALSEVE